VSKDGISTLKFPAKLKYLADVLPNTAYESLSELFKPILALEDRQLLHDMAAPSAVQLRMTAYLLRRTHNLIEEVEADPKTEQLLMAAALQCPPLELRRKKLAE
jgi:hypothetical protein